MLVSSSERSFAEADLRFLRKRFHPNLMELLHALLLMLILFLSFSIYNHSLFNQFNARYQKEIDQYYSILELKNHFLQSGILFEEYMKTGNRTTLAEFNDTYEKARSVIDILYTESTNEESWYLLRGIDACKYLLCRMAAHTVFNTMARVISSRFLYPRLDAIIPAITITPIPHKRPGRYPAMNSAEIDTLPATVEYTIRVLLGGISIPVGADAILTAAI